MTDPLITELIEARKAAGLTQRQLADRMHCVQSHVSMLEAGRTDLQLDTLRRWAGALGLRPAWVPETAPATSVVAGNGAPRLGEGPADEDAPASDPVSGRNGDRADVAPVATRAQGGPLPTGMAIFSGEAARIARELNVPVFIDGDGSDTAVARTLDVAEATADRNRAVGLARETR